MRPQKFIQEYREMPDPVMGISDETFPADSCVDYSTVEYTGNIEESKAIIQRIENAIDERHEQSSGVFERVLVIGVQDYVAADAWIRHDTNNNSSLKQYLSVEVVVVPGRMIHVPKTHQRALLDHLKGDDE